MPVKLWRVNAAASILEVTASIAILLAVTFYVTVQDTSSMFQAQRDARQALAQLWLENEVALCRVSQPPWVTNSPNNRLSRYSAGAGSVETDIRLVDIGLGAVGVGPAMQVTEYSSRFGGRRNQNTPLGANRVTRTILTNSANGLDGLVFQTYEVRLDIPYSLPDGRAGTNTYTRQHRRVFQSGP
jgi:hypothetical protein